MKGNNMSKKFNTNNLNLAYEIDEDETAASSDIASRILSLSDSLSEEIVLTNINDHISGNSPWPGRINYISSYREKVEDARTDPDNLDLSEFIREITERVIATVLDGLKKNYSVSIGRDLEESNDIYKYLEDIETLYEFFFVRNYENVKDILYKTLITKRQYFIDRYRELYNDQDEDLFITTQKKKFKNFDDVLICNFISDIIFDIMEMYESGYELFKAIVNLDLYEVFNNRMLDLLINYGEGIVFLSDAKASEKYFAILQDKDTFIEIRNEILLKYLENVEVDENYGNA
jgi:hypothetical protein